MSVPELLATEASGPWAPISARIAALPAPARSALEPICVAAAALPHAILVQAAGLDPTTFAAALELLEAARLIRAGRTSHGDAAVPADDRVRAAVVAELTAERRRRVHERIAEALEAAGGATREPRALVHHLAAAGLTVRAADLAGRAGHAASAAMAHDDAADLYGAALRLGEHDDGSRRALERARAAALAALGRGPEAADAFLAAAEGASHDASLDHRRAAAEQLLVSGHLERGLDILASVLEDAGVRIPQTAGEARRALRWHWGRLLVRGTRWRARPAREIPARDLLRVDVYRTLSLGLGMVDSQLGADFQARGLLLALDVGEPLRVAHALAFHAVYLASRGGRRLASAPALAKQAREIAETSQDPTLLAWTAAVAGVIDSFAGRFDTAARTLAASAEELRELPSETWSPLAHTRVFQLMCLRHTGDFATMRPLAEDCARDAGRRGDRYAETTMIWSANILWLADDDPARAQYELARCTWTPPERGYHLQHWFATRARIEVALYLLAGAHPAATPLPRPIVADLAVLDAELDRAAGSQFMDMQVVRAETLWLRGRLAAARGHLATARSTARALAREGIGYATAWGLLLEAAIARGADKPGDAAIALRGAALAAEASEMPILVELARRRVGELVGGDDGDAMLASADAWLRAHGVRAPARFAEVLAPAMAPRSRNRA